MIADRLAKLNRSSRNSIFAAIVVIAGVAMYNWIVSPHVAYLHAAQKYDSAVGKIVEKNKAVTRELDGKKKELEKLRDQYSQCLGLLFTPDEAKELFGDLQTTLEETGCTVSSLNLIASKPGPGNKLSEDTSDIVANSAILSISGQYSNIMKLLEKLQNHPQKVWVDSFKVKIIDFGSAQLQCDMTITIYTIQDREVTL